MKFIEDGDEVKCEWVPEKHFEGFHNILHGGIQATLMDEIASWTVLAKLKTAGVTSNLQTRYRKPALMDQGNFFLNAKIVDQRRNLVDIDVKLKNAEGQIISESVVTYYTFSKEIARKMYYFPEEDDAF
jgi:acyl-coenzyme A thioesterase PaaI-like protein